MNNENEIERIISTIQDVNEIYVREVDEDGFSDIGYSDRYAINYNVAKALVNAGIGDKKQAIKEFAEELKNRIIEDTAYGSDYRQHTGYYDYTIKIGEIPEYIDNLITELYGKEN